jgi:hypothetical protein
MTTKGVVTAIFACPVTLMLVMTIIHSLNLFPGTAVNRVSIAVISVVKCHFDRSELDPLIGGMRKLNAQSVSNVVSGQTGGFIISNDDRFRMRFNQQGVFLGQKYGVFSRPHDEPVSSPRYLMIGPDICISVNRYVGVTSFYVDAQRHLFEVTYSARDHKIFSHRM